MIDGGEVVRIFLQKFFTQCDGSIEVFVLNHGFDATAVFVKTAVLQLPAQKCIHGDVKEIGDAHQCFNFRHGCAGFPFGYSADGYAQSLCELFLSEILLLSQSSDIFGKMQFHFACLLFMAL